MLILGDSQLIIDFAARRSRPNKASLFLALRRIQDLLRALKKQGGCSVRFGHIPRAFNSVSDWAGNVSRRI